MDDLKDRLGPDAAAVIDDLIATGNYDTPAEVLRAGLRRLSAERAEYDRKLAALLEAIDEGEASGPARALDWDAWLAEKRRQHGE